MIVYFAPWCGNWRNEAPIAAKLFEKYKDQGFQVIGISEYASRDDVKKFFGDAGAPYPIVTNSQVGFFMERFTREHRDTIGMSLGRSGRFISMIRETLKKSGLDLGKADSFVHGSTTEINTAIERTGARTALITTMGMRDVYEIARDNRMEAYNVFFKRVAPFTPRHLVFEVNERLDHKGEVVTAFDEAAARAGL